MKITRHLRVPTGDILVVEGQHGSLEVLSLGDYGKDVNLSLKPVADRTPIMPLTEKWVITVSTQYGCAMNCRFCDAPEVDIGRNADIFDLCGQISTVMNLPRSPKTTRRLNVHFARMGEPTFNPAVLQCARWLKGHPAGMPTHPVVSTMMPRRNLWLRPFIREWVHIKNSVFDGNAGLQISVNSTDEDERRFLFDNNSCTLQQIAEIMEGLHPVGRKFTLNFAIGDATIDPQVLLSYFHPADYIIKLTPMHKTATAVRHSIQTAGEYTTPEPYLRFRDALLAAGYEVLVFIASAEEDDSRITCGNAILSGNMPKTFEEIK